MFSAGVHLFILFYVVLLRKDFNLVPVRTLYSLQYIMLYWQKNSIIAIREE